VEACATACVCPGDQPQRRAEAFVRLLNAVFSILLGIVAINHLCKYTSVFAVAQQFKA
jgi:hypothetical protein